MAVPDVMYLSQLDPDDVEQLRKGVREFNAGMFFECHDTIEDVWHGIRGPARDFFQGLIQVAVGFYHLGTGNRQGGQSQLEKGLRKLERYPSPYLGIELDDFRIRTAEWLEKVRSGGEIGGHVRDLPKICFIA